MISHRLLAKNTIWNLLGQALSLPLAFVAIPILIKELGTDRFGILMMAWVAIGYFSLFDLGLGQALSKMVAERLGKQEEKDVPSLIWTSLVLMVVFGLVGSILLVLLTPWLVLHLLKIPVSLQSEAAACFYWIAASLPFVISTGGLAGILAAKQRFDLLSATRMLIAGVTYIGPLAILPLTTSLSAVTGVLVVGRLVAWAVYFVLCFRVTPSLASGLSLKPAFAVPLMRFGGWLTVSGVFGPIMVYADRFLIGAMVSITAVTYYATPYELITKLWIIPGAVSGVLFPAFASTSRDNPHRTQLLFTRGIKYLFIVLFPITLLIVSFAQISLDLWLGVGFAQQSFRLLQWLAVGVFINSLAQIPFVFLQGSGRPDLPAKFHLIELPCYVVAVFVLIGEWGVEGAAIAWVARVAVDALLLFSAAWRFLGTTATAIGQQTLAVGTILLLFAVAALPMAWSLKTAFLAATLAIFSLSAWLGLLSLDERVMIRSWLKQFFVRVPSSGD